MEYFHHLVEYQLVVCKECGYAVWPDQIEGHLTGKHHKMQRKNARSVAEEVRSWGSLVPFASELNIPEKVDRAIAQLPLYKDGLMCKLDTRRCKYICRDKKTLEGHWRQVHQWSVTAGREGGSGRPKKEMVERRYNEATKQVYCQRFFASRGGSQYFEVERVEERQSEDGTARGAGEALWNQVHNNAMKRWGEIEKKNAETIQQVQKIEANPWLERTGWSKYLKGLNRPDLLKCIREPIEDPDAQEEGEEKEVIEAAIWKAMGDVAEISQASIVDRVGVFVRMEVIRTEQHQTRYQPLQPYQNEDDIKDHVRPWRQVLMFFARTQRDHDWASPEYQFTRSQQRAWDELIEQAREVVDDSDDDDEVDDDDADDDDTDDTENEEEVGQDHETPTQLNNIQKACLNFCIELLNQTITRHEYHSALVCALAVLGVNDDGWKGPDRYPPILSSMIKISRFMVVQKALDISKVEDEFNDDRPYDFEIEDTITSPAAASARKKQGGCLQLVAKMMDKFMVRGSHSPMQWMLDLRTYGLKIHYNTTATGHIGWQGYDEILYKNIQFNMSQFRGMVHSLVEQCQQLMKDELLFCSSSICTEDQIPKVPWKLLRDNPTDQRPGWNFLQDQRTRMPVDGQTWLFDHIGQHDSIRKRFLRPGSQSGVNKESLRAYIEQVMRFKEKLLILVHITGECMFKNFCQRYARQRTRPQICEGRNLHDIPGS